MPTLALATPPNFPASVADVIRAFRNALKLTQQELAHELGVSKNFVSIMELGRNEPDRHTLASWYTGESEIAHRIAIEIFIVRSREMLSLGRRASLN